MEILATARKRTMSDIDLGHVVDHAMVAGEQHDGQVLYLGPDRAGNLLEIVSVLRDDRTEIVIHAVRMRRIYESFLDDKGDIDG